MPKGRQCRQILASVRSFSGGKSPSYYGLIAQIRGFVGASPLGALWPNFSVSVCLKKTKDLLSPVSGRNDLPGKSATFVGESEIQGQLGSKHAMNFGRNPNIFGVFSA